MFMRVPLLHDILKTVLRHIASGLEFGTITRVPRKSTKMFRRTVIAQGCETPGHPRVSCVTSRFRALIGEENHSVDHRASKFGRCKTFKVDNMALKKRVAA